MDIQVVTSFGFLMFLAGGLSFKYVSKYVSKTTRSESREISTNVENTQGPVVTTGGDANVVINPVSEKDEDIDLTDAQWEIFQILAEADYVVIYSNSRMCAMGPSNLVGHLRRGSELVSAVKELGDLGLATREQENAFGDDASRARTTYRISARGRQYLDRERARRSGVRAPVIPPK